MAFVRVASLAEVPAGTVIEVDAEGQGVCLVNCEGEVYAIANNCSHRDFPLSEGEVDEDDCTITCEWHGAIFDLRTGAPRSLPATRPVAVYACRVDGDEIHVDVSTPA